MWKSVPNFFFPFIIMLFSPAAAQAYCSSYPNNLTNGSPADATQVMANFGCAALTSGSTIESLTSTNGQYFAHETDTFSNYDNTLGLSSNGFLYLQGNSTGGLWLAANSGRQDNIAIRNTTHEIDFNTNGGPNSLVINSAGHVGIGTASPNLTFQTNGAVGSSITSDSVGFQNYALVNARYQFADAGGYWGIREGVTSHNINFDVWNGGTALTALTITNAGGDVGVATVNPNLTFQVNGAIGSSITSDSVGFQSYALVNTRYQIVDAAGYWGIREGATSHNVNFDVQNGGAPLTALTITNSGGNVGIGTATPGQRLDVAGTIRQSNCTTAGTLSTNTAGDIICTSDARLKNVLGVYGEGLSAIRQLSPKRFTYKATKNDPVETFVHAGFIAQNVKAAIPEAVAKQRNGYYSLDTTAVLATAVNAIKELEIENRTLASEIRELRGEHLQQAARIDQLRGQLAAMQHRSILRTAQN